jgi:uncharacterized protein YgiM (DUF1202 family)
MRNLLICLLSVILLSSCTDVKVEGKYYLIKSNGREDNYGGQINEIIFREDSCSFEVYKILSGGPVRVEKNTLYLDIGGELGTLTMEIIDWQTLEGEGFIGGTFKREDYYRATNKSVLGYYIATRPIYMRAGAGNRYAIIKTINEGEKVNNIQKFDNGWSQVEYGGLRGFVQTKYLRKE